MIFVKFASGFTSQYALLSSNNRDLKSKIDKRIKIFVKDPKAKILKNHKLSQKMSGMWAFSVTGDIRIVYKKLNKNTVRFLAIGTHRQVYRN